MTAGRAGRRRPRRRGAGAGPCRALARRAPGAAQRTPHRGVPLTDARAGTRVGTGGRRCASPSLGAVARRLCVIVPLSLRARRVRRGWHLARHRAGRRDARRGVPGPSPVGSVGTPPATAILGSTGSTPSGSGAPMATAAEGEGDASDEDPAQDLPGLVLEAGGLGVIIADTQIDAPDFGTSAKRRPFDGRPPRRAARHAPAHLRRSGAHGARPAAASSCSLRPATASSAGWTAAPRAVTSRPPTASRSASPSRTSWPGARRSPCTAPPPARGDVDLGPRRPLRGGRRGPLRTAG